MDILGKSNSLSYAAAWGMLAYLAADIIFEQQYAVDIKGPKFLTGKFSAWGFLRIIKFAHASLCNVMMMPLTLQGLSSLQVSFLLGIKNSNNTKTFLYTRLESALKNLRFCSLSMQV